MQSHTANYDQIAQKRHLIQVTNDEHKSKNGHQVETPLGYFSVA